jgi:4-aminobutyrate aminotransferase-like enzyme
MADLDIRDLLLVDVELSSLKLPCQLEEFEDVQDGHISDLVDTLRNDWVYKVYMLVEPMLPSDGDLEEQEAFFQAVQEAQEGEPDLVRPWPDSHTPPHSFLM